MLNEDLEQKVSELQHEVQNLNVQLAEMREHLGVSDRQNEKLIDTTNKDKMTIFKLETKVEKLSLARQKMAAIYGLPAYSPVASPDRINPPIHLGSLTSRSTPSSSPPTEITLQASASHDHIGPPAKRQKRSGMAWTPIESPIESNTDITRRSSTMWSPTRSPIESNVDHARGPGAGLSTDTAISLDDDEQLPVTPTSRGPHLQPIRNMDIPKEVFTTYELVAKVGTWSSAQGNSVCGFCMLENTHSDQQIRHPLRFDALLYPAQYWQHCVTEHKVAWRPDIDNFLKTMAQKSPSINPVVEMMRKFALMVSWKTDIGPYACGLCQLENTHQDHDPLPLLSINSHVDYRLFWSHCRSEHAPFWNPASQSSASQSIM
ncbi:hypothetical protein DFH11DRAFT_1296541 [Phellopilus nigrolimitatus]|nr:hypothetical protein DFH11DRAFT_1296541 [Phellopilus nigrolimitatus]